MPAVAQGEAWCSPTLVKPRMTLFGESHWKAQLCLLAAGREVSLCLVLQSSSSVRNTSVQVCWGSVGRSPARAAVLEAAHQGAGCWLQFAELLLNKQRPRLVSKMS